MLFAAGQATKMTIGLILTFGGVGAIVGGIAVYIMIQVRGEHQQNEQFRASRRTSTNGPS